METLMSGLMLNNIGWLIGLKTLFSVSAFYMQRLRHENPSMRGSSIPGPMLMSLAANLMSWCVLALTAYVWYRLGWLAALAFFVIPFVLAISRARPLRLPDHRNSAAQPDRSRDRAQRHLFGRTHRKRDQRDKSSANAVGLMQVTPEAGRDTAKRFGVAYDWDRMVSDPV